ncbi:hypothetical protein BD779DRAFT_1556091 [Infundibulicybe gibba]|nr:hypothetical protein BD779DRAFT_1556091 [Infundibulicybe gibba]
MLIVDTSRGYLRSGILASPASSNASSTPALKELWTISNAEITLDGRLPGTLEATSHSTLIAPAARIRITVSRRAAPLYIFFYARNNLRCIVTDFPTNARMVGHSSEMANVVCALIISRALERIVVTLFLGYELRIMPDEPLPGASCGTAGTGELWFISVCLLNAMARFSSKVGVDSHSRTSQRSRFRDRIFDCEIKNIGVSLVGDVWL